IENKEEKKVEKPPTPESDSRELAQRAAAILQANCYRCHGQDGARKGGFHYVLDSRRLTEHRKIVPGRPEQSELLRRIVDGEMPPEDEQPRPGPQEIAVLRRWIEAGAPEFAPPPPPRSTITPDSQPKLVRADLAALPERDRRFARYFSLIHLHNAGLSADEL